MVIETDTSKIWKGEDGIVRVVNQPGAEITLEQAKSDFDKARQSIPDEKVCLLVDATGVKSVDREARAFFASQEYGTFVKAQAIIANSPTSRMIANFFLNLNKPSFPIRFFTSEKDALKWLAQFQSDGP